MTTAGEGDFRCGLVALVGRPNVGKSTLLNRILGQKLTITSRKPQTTRHQILGIKTTPDSQTIYVDTPGLHAGHSGALSRYMNQAAVNAIQDVDVVIWMVDAAQWTRDDDHVSRHVCATRAKRIVAINKVDRLARKEALLPLLERLSALVEGAELIPISARTGDNVAQLETLATQRLPTAPAMFPEDQLTDRSTRFVAAEFIREQLIMRLGQEVPYRLSVEIEYFEEQAHRVDVGAVVWVERDSQKAIVIGRQGRLLKSVGTAARRELTEMLGVPVHLKLWAKVKPGWSDDGRALKQFGYE